VVGAHQREARAFLLERDLVVWAVGDVLADALLAAAVQMDDGRPADELGETSTLIGSSS
jgi:hypothetical protein